MSTPYTEKNFFIHHATKLAIGSITLLMVIVTLVLLKQSEANKQATDWVMHTYEVIARIESLFSKIKDAELGQRGFIITGDNDFLQPYEEALRDSSQTNQSKRSLKLQRSIAQELALLRSMIKDNPVQQSNVDEMEETIAKLLQHLKNSIEQKRNSITKGSAFISDIERSKAMLDRIRSLVRIMIAEETHLLQLRTEISDTKAQNNLWVTLIGLGFFYLLITISIFLYQRSRARAQSQILAYTHELERREEELKMQQEELKASNEEIEASNEELEEKTNALEEQNMRVRQQSRELEHAKVLIEEKIKEVELSNKYKSEFLANMSHELRTPLNSLLILARGFATNEEGNLTTEQVEEARVIHSGGLELLNLINDILDLSKVEAGKVTIITEDIYIGDIAKRMSQSFDPIAKESGVLFKLVLEESLPDTLHTDSQRVEQILKNLLSNAFKFTEKGSVTLAISRIRNDDDVVLQRISLTNTEALAFTVSDTGIGIEESKFKDIFEAFQQEDGSTDRHYGGTGLGLTIARKFANLLGGEIHVASTKGEGSTFTLFLPLTHIAPSSASATPKAQYAVSEPQTPQKAVSHGFVPDDRQSINAGDKVLLIIEDDRDFAKTLKKIAAKRGYKVLIAEDGKSGLMLAESHEVTAIILDLRLPDIDGMCVLEQLKYSLHTRHIPVHIISGMVTIDTVTPLQKGAIGYLTKPVEKEDIDAAFSRIEKMLSAKVKKVLVIEDDKSTQTAIHSLLKQKNIELVITATGKEALTHIKTDTFDCIILDLKLPDMTGFSWLEALEKQEDTVKTPPVIIYTAKDLNEEENRKLASYTDSIIIKGASSSERLLDEVTLFLHSVESTLTSDQQAIIRMQHNPDRVLQDRTVMLVDDDMRNTFALSKLLKKYGMQVIIADNGQMALEKLQEHNTIDLVIMDIMMPVMDGYQAMREIRANSLWHSLPIIALTARAMPEEQVRCMEAGANDYLTKPVDIEQLLTLLRVWLFKQERGA